MRNRLDLSYEQISLENILSTVGPKPYTSLSPEELHLCSTTIDAEGYSPLADMITRLPHKRSAILRKKPALHDKKSSRELSPILFTLTRSIPCDRACSLMMYDHND
ncbi:hypothetical protein M404DRAFT_638130 [Pisolithus tinctorius Marx 270]|uniref:Uncharacterized protein n=1 Tax=Pisolithus tinctorius Marx 270 TaxID=870435 RepID=A0A0C3P610_PISTI|nr:hypothetical protein M404DRAFT_638130 [Pisolithus tinctorius Marx 270]